MYAPCSSRTHGVRRRRPRQSAACSSATKRRASITGTLPLSTNSKLVAATLPLAAVVAPAILGLGPVEAERMPARLIARACMNQDAGHLLGMDGRHEATVGTCFQSRPG